MFKAISAQYAVNAETGISLEVTGPYSLRYANNDYIADIASEPIKKDDKYSVCVYLSDLETWESPDLQPVSANDKQDIERHVRDALRALNVDVEVA